MIYCKGVDCGVLYRLNSVLWEQGCVIVSSDVGSYVITVKLLDCISSILLILIDTWIGNMNILVLIGDVSSLRLIACTACGVPSWDSHG
jgi:hypothetical protein